MSRFGRESGQGPVEPVSVQSPELEVEVAYATPRRQRIIALRVPAGSTAADGIALSGIREEFAEIGENPEIGIFSNRVALDYVLQEGDRVEIYRPLIADPKEERRRKARDGRRAGIGPRQG